VRGNARAAIALAVITSACAARGFVPPRGAGTPASDAAQLFATVTSACAKVESLTAEAALSGRVDRGRVRGRLHVGLTSAGQIRLEAVAPFGQPLFTLAGNTERATLWLPRDGRVLRDAAPADIMEVLAGVALSPVEFLHIATGCLGTGQKVARAERFPSGLVHVSTDGGVDFWGKPADSFRPVAVARGDVWAEYLEYEAGEPAALRLVRRPESGQPTVDLRVSFSQRERNARLDAAAFQLDVPADAKPISLEELKRAGLFGS
jgi:hypothetical protein